VPVHRRHALAAILGSSLPAFAAAQSDWPNRPIKMVVPLTAGGPTDLLGRILAQPLGERLGQTIVIDNRPGAGGDIGADFVAHSDPDGYTLLLGTSGPLSINATLYGNLHFDPVKDFAPVMLVANAPFLVVVNPSLPVKSLPELIAYAKAHPGKLNDGSVTGSAAHLATELFKRSAHLDFVHVSYKGAAVATNDLLAGQIDLSFASTPGVMGHVRAGKLRALAVTSTARMKELPDVPTVAEAGVPGYEASVWYGVAAPAGTPAAIVARLNTELTRLLQDKKVLQQMAQNDFHPLGSTPAQFGAFIKSESDKWGKVVKAAGLKAS
jgi:tripartite-type tricarboxylate transporter receptor subunit TctC